MNPPTPPVVAIPASERGFIIDKLPATVNNIATAVINRMKTVNGTPDAVRAAAITVHFSITHQEWITMKSNIYPSDTEMERALSRVIREKMKNLRPQPRVVYQRCLYQPTQTGTTFFFSEN